MVTPALSGSTYTVNKANIVCGNVQTANATVYIIDTVLMLLSVTAWAIPSLTHWLHTAASEGICGTSSSTQ